MNKVTTAIALLLLYNLSVSIQKLSIKSLFTICCLFQYSTTLAEFTAQDCRELGFIKSQLLCSNCGNLKDFGLEEIKEQCIECCQKESVGSAARKYPKAILEICTCSFQTYPQIQAFLKSERPSKFKNLEIKYLRGLEPQIKLLDIKGNVVETLSIVRWNTDTVQEFFETHLEMDEPDDFLRNNRI